MKFFSQCVLCAVIAVVASAAVGQDGPPSQYEKVKDLEPYIGFWSGDFQPPGGPKGRVNGFGRWTSNRSFAQFNWMFRPEEGRPMHVLTVLMGWNGKTQKLHSWGYGPEGHGSGEIVIKDGALTINSKGTTVDGQEMTSSATYKITDGKLTVTVSDQKVGDQKMPGYTFTAEKREFPGRAFGEGRGQRGPRRQQAEPAE